MKRPWMPIYWGDFQAKTTHLSAEECGIYLLLIGHYWCHGGIPQTQLTRSRVARLSLKKWKAVEPIIQVFFNPDWTHDRIDDELEKANRISSRRAAAGSLGGKANVINMRKQN